MSNTTEQNIIDICRHEECTGCFACFNVCGHNAIVVTEDELGCKYPKIDLSLCFSCGLCSKVCPANHPTEKHFPKECYALVQENSEKLNKSASGGAATIFADYILSQGGIVYGCSGEDMRNVKHIRITDPEDLWKLQGSKYVQSQIYDLFRQLRKDVFNDNMVLFIGTPCQVAGIRNLIGKRKDNLFLIDLVCHGVPSQRLLNENIDYYSRKNPRILIDSIRFRKKINFLSANSKIEFGWNYKDGHKDYFIPWYKDPYMRAFLGCLSFRSSCYLCPYAYSVRGSDITIADFWGLGQDAQINEGSGVSSVLINNDSGKLFFDKIKRLPDVKIVQRPVQEAISGNGQLMCPTRKKNSVTQFRILYPSIGLKNATKKVMKRDLTKFRLKKILKILKILG